MVVNLVVWWVVLTAYLLVGLKVERLAFSGAEQKVGSSVLSLVEKMEL